MNKLKAMKLASKVFSGTPDIMSGASLIQDQYGERAIAVRCLKSDTILVIYGKDIPTVEMLIQLTKKEFPVVRQLPSK